MEKFLWKVVHVFVVVVFVIGTIGLTCDTATGQSNVAEQGKSGYASINGLKMYYEIRGHGQPAVFIHPIASQCALIPELTKNRQWIVVDLQGHGRTADIDRSMTCEQHADDIASLLKFLKIDRADFFGDSFGGAIAVTMAVRHPKMVRRVVAYGNVLTPFPKNIAEVVTADSDLVKWEREAYFKTAPNPKHWPAFFAKVLQCGTTWKGISPSELKLIKAPVLIACGDHDLVPVESCSAIARQMPGGQLAVIPDASHFVLFSEPEKLLPVVAAFLDAPSPRLPLSTFSTGYYPGVTR